MPVQAIPKLYDIIITNMLFNNVHWQHSSINVMSEFAAYLIEVKC